MNRDCINEVRTRSGRVVRQVQRYEPEVTEMIDDNDDDYESSEFSESPDDDTTDEDETYGDEDETSDTESLSTLTLSPSSTTERPVSPTSEIDGDVIDWDLLTEQASSGDEDTF